MKVLDLRDPAFLKIPRGPVGPAAFRSADSGVVASPATTITVNKPTGALTQDVVAVALAAYNGTNFTAPDADWVLLGHLPWNNDNFARLSVFRLIVRAGEGASWNFTGGAPGANGHSWGSICMSGVDITTPEDGSIAGLKDDVVDTSIQAPAVSPSGSNSLLVAWFADITQGNTHTNPTGMTKRFNNAGIFPGLGISGHTQVLSASGSTGTRTTTITTSGRGAGVLQAFKSAA